jgi:hypothetical protein
VNGSAVVALVHTGATFQKGVLVESIAKQEEVAAWSADGVNPQLLALPLSTV